MVAAFELDQIVRNLYDPRADRLALAGFRRSPKQTRHIGLWRSVAFYHLDALARLQGREVSRCRIDVGVSDRLGKFGHQLWRRSARDGRAPSSALVVRHLLNDVTLGQSCEIGVFRSTGPGRAVTVSACKHIGLATTRNDVR